MELKSWHWQGSVPSGGSLSFLASGDHLGSLAQALPPASESHRHTLLLHSSKDPCDYIWPTQIIGDNLFISGSFITPARSLWSCKVKFTGGEFRM